MGAGAGVGVRAWVQACGEWCCFVWNGTSPPLPQALSSSSSSKWARGEGGEAHKETKECRRCVAAVTGGAADLMLMLILLLLPPLWLLPRRERAVLNL